ncbi:MAG: phosphoribosylamine--glycine ligase [Candidatus Saganbacteria bacterium]|nr:phosphoribosylamine--glycine ligase [Candidatus Saganbacteria bacterium]
MTELKQFALKNKIDLTVVGPEAPLVGGIVDEFEFSGLRIFGPSKEAANIEGSKVFAKDLMVKWGVPTARAMIFNDPDAAIKYVEKEGAPIVIKAKGLAQGKGVYVCRSVDEAKEAIHLAMREKIFGEAGDEILIEECLIGEEASILAFTDGKTIVPMASAQDHKAIFDGDKGPNTGGMGAYSPAPVVTKEIEKLAMEQVFKPIINGMAKEKTPYKGVLYAGLMITKDGPKVLEFNVRFGDPETQAIIPRMKSDLIPVIEAVIDGRLGEVKIEWDDRAAVCVVMASGGYPGNYKKGIPIFGLDKAAELRDVMVFHAGTKKEAGKIVTSGGRVLGVTGLGDTISQAIDNVYRAVRLITFDGMQYRIDIGKKALRR